MDAVSHYFRSVFSVTYLVFNWFKRLIWRKSGYRDEESLLPVAVNTNSKTSTQFNYSSSSIVNTYNTNINSNWNLINNRNQNIQQVRNDDQEAEIDYFEDMQPTMLKQKKVYITPQKNFQQSVSSELNYSPTTNYQSDRLNFDSKNTYQSTNELGFLDDGQDVGWENDIDADKTHIDENMKHIRQAEIERRIAEHKRIKMERELKKTKNPKNFMATKIS